MSCSAPPSIRLGDGRRAATAVATVLVLLRRQTSRLAGRAEPALPRSLESGQRSGKPVPSLSRSGRRDGGADARQRHNGSPATAPGASPGPPRGGNRIARRHLALTDHGHDNSDHGPKTDRRHRKDRKQCSIWKQQSPICLSPATGRPAAWPGHRQPLRGHQPARLRAGRRTGACQRKSAQKGVSDTHHVIQH